VLRPLVDGFLVERYWPGVTPDGVRCMNDRLGAVQRADIVFLGSILVAADEVVLFAFRAADAVTVAALGQQAGLRCDRIVAVAYAGSIS
jgi:hypothetical protein